MHEVIVLLPGYAEWTQYGRQRAGGTVTLLKGDPNVLVDTGAPHQRRALLDALREHGLKPSDIKYVINTHGQLDHIGNNNLFPRATFLLDMDVSREGEYWIHNFHEDAFHIGGSDRSPTIAVIPTPGHTDHDLSVIVETKIGTVAIVGDLFEYEGDWRDRSWEHWSKSKKMHKGSRERILRIADYIVPGHGDMFHVPSLAQLELAPTPDETRGQDRFIHKHRNEIEALAKRWQTHWCRVDADRIEAWLRQFGDYSATQSVFPLLQHVFYLDDARITDIFADFHERLMEDTKREVVFSILGGPKDSSSFVSYVGSKTFPERERRRVVFDQIETIAQQYDPARTTLALVDDTINSGHQACRIFKEWFGTTDAPHEHVTELSESTKNWLRSAQVVAFFLIGFRAGLGELRAAMRLLRLNARVEAARVEEPVGCFDPGAAIFDNPQVRLQARKLAAEIGEQLFTDVPGWDEGKRRLMALGYGRAQKLIVFSYNTPNCTLPILWKKGTYNGVEWLPLFPRRD